MASAKTEYLRLTVFPDISGVYQRELRIALVTGEHGNDSNMHIIDSAIKTLAEAMGALAPVASSGSYNDLTDKPDIPSQIPVASSETAGIVKPDGETILVDENGKISAAVKAAIATLEAAGLVKPDGTTITIAEDGTITAAITLASTETAGIVKPDGESITVDADGTIHSKVKDAYTKAEVDKMLSDMSDLFMSADDMTAIYTAVNTLMGETTEFTSLGASILTINDQASELIS